MGHATHAVVMTLRRDLFMDTEQKREFRRTQEQGARRVPGFVGGLWTLDQKAGEVVIIISFDSLDSAVAFAVFAQDNAAKQTKFGLELLSVRVSEVMASVSLR